ncbi:uncharacterized protein [Narcine bancroftii]|uniref:uncharacterized protein isoform X2 n=1 Tax=Narcine bancroftii TaxID=1343680 RepID=UPI003831C771
MTMLPLVLILFSLLLIDGGLSLRSVSDECLKFEVLCTTEYHQFRRYNASVWVSTRVNTTRSGGRRVYRKLLMKYTRGLNSEGLRFQSTGQFLKSVTEGGEVSLHLLLPKELQANPPAPIDNQVFIKRFSRMNAFVKEIKGNARIQANIFNCTLTEENAKFNNSIFFIANCKRGLFEERKKRELFRRSLSSSNQLESGSGSEFDEDSEWNGSDSEFDEDSSEGPFEERKKRELLRRSLSASNQLESMSDSEFDEDSLEWNGSDSEFDEDSSEGPFEERKKRELFRRREIWFISTESSNCPIS